METHPFSRSNSALRVLRGPRAGTPEPSVGEAATFYQPPYDRELDDAFVRTLVKYLGPLTDFRVVHNDGNSSIVVEAQAGEPSPSGSRRNRRIGFLVQSETPEGAAPLFPSGKITVAGEDVDILYILRMPDVAHRLLDALFLISRWDEHLFSTRGQLNLRRLATPEAREATVHPGSEDVQVSYADESGTFSLLLTNDVMVPMDLHIRRFRSPRSYNMSSDAPPPTSAPRRRYRRSA